MTETFDSCMGYEFVREIPTHHRNYQMWEDEDGDVWFYWSGSTESMRRPICIEQSPAFSILDVLQDWANKSGGNDE